MAGRCFHRMQESQAAMITDAGIGHPYNSSIRGPQSKKLLQLSCNS